jgi:hypothetical protein
VSAKLHRQRVRARTDGQWRRVQEALAKVHSAGVTPNVYVHCSLNGECEVCSLSEVTRRASMPTGS